MSKPTPGPWSVIGEPIPVEPVPGYPIACIEDAYYPVAHVFSDDPAGLANAHLIAAAPMMRDALAQALAEPEHSLSCPIATYATQAIAFQYRDDCTCWVKQAVAALAASAPPPTADAGAEDGG